MQKFLFLVQENHQDLNKTHVKLFFFFFFFCKVGFIYLSEKFIFDYEIDVNNQKMHIFLLSMPVSHSWLCV